MAAHVKAKGIEALRHEDAGGRLIEFDVLAEVVDEDNRGPFAVKFGPALDVNRRAKVIDRTGKSHILFGFEQAIADAERRNGIYFLEGRKQ